MNQAISFSIFIMTETVTVEIMLAGRGPYVYIQSKKGKHAVE
jgi:hypothetical protein